MSCLVRRLCHVRLFPRHPVRGANENLSVSKLDGAKLPSAGELPGPPRLLASAVNPEQSVFDVNSDRIPRRRKIAGTASGSFLRSEAATAFRHRRYHRKAAVIPCSLSSHYDDIASNVGGRFADMHQVNPIGTSVSARFRPRCSGWRPRSTANDADPRVTSCASGCWTPAETTQVAGRPSTRRSIAAARQWHGARAH